MHNYASHYYRLDYKQTDKMHSNASHCYRLDYRRRTRCITMHHTVTDSTSTTSHIHTLQKRSFAWWTNHIIFKPLTHCHSSTMIRPKKYKYNTTKKRPPKGYSDDRMSAWSFPCSETAENGVLCWIRMDKATTNDSANNSKSNDRMTMKFQTMMVPPQPRTWLWKKEW